MSANRLAPGMQIGDYLLKEILHEGETVRTWLAQQVSVQREVIIDSLNSAVHRDEILVTNFLSDIRAKARLDHPLIGSVFEAIQEQDICAYARENLSGTTLEQLTQANNLLTPREIVHILRQIAEANLYLENNNIASLPIQPHEIFFGDKYLTRMVNMAVGGERLYDVATQDKAMLGASFLALIKPSQPGATRTTSLLTIMADQKRDPPITWEQIRELSEGIERQLSQQQPSAALSPESNIKEKQQSTKTVYIAVGTFAICAIIALILYAKSNAPDPPRETSYSVEIPTGRYPTHDGQKVKHQPFTIDAHEVTIAEYKKFLDYLSTAAALGTEDIFDHENQPDEKADHIPADWEAMYKAARKNKPWIYLEGSSPVELILDLNSPVINVDWYDAYAYAEWKKHRLPTQEEWYAALSFSNTEPESLEASAYGPVDQISNDITDNNIHGLAGNVTEWTRVSGRNPALPSMPKRPILCGGSFRRNKTNGATAREWVETRLERRPDLGFRTVKATSTN